MALAGITIQHDDNGYYRRGNSGNLLVCNMFVLQLPDGTNTYGSVSGECKGRGSVQGIESCKIMFLGGTFQSFIQVLLLQDESFSYNAQHHR